eukprot:Plantae.Rhodophyta-Hildenbrandia_rubra.ctg13407.p1 GENE.Plantae.Rhodophyta-Hildenbrandia_rubra.ctg13407~~Plantae.Rhodophyta-Hildenbrandia_rubra.ctg13407.p1  ORF type:complete len:416 (-),score=50.59 Plantae.Rhodophyta-Hildenbrandia_rubra.ctg13407:292-1539(-)
MSKNETQKVVVSTTEKKSGLKNILHEYANGIKRVLRFRLRDEHGEVLVDEKNSRLDVDWPIPVLSGCKNAPYLFVDFVEVSWREYFRRAIPPAVVFQKKRYPLEKVTEAKVKREKEESSLAAPRTEADSGHDASAGAEVEAISTSRNTQDSTIGQLSSSNRDKHETDSSDGSDLKLFVRYSSDSTNHHENERKRWSSLTWHDVSPKPARVQRWESFIETGKRYLVEDKGSVVDYIDFEGNIGRRASDEVAPLQLTFLRAMSELSMFRGVSVSFRRDPWVVDSSQWVCVGENTVAPFGGLDQAAAVALDDPLTSARELLKSPALKRDSFAFGHMYLYMLHARTKYGVLSIYDRWVYLMLSQNDQAGVILNVSDTIERESPFALQAFYYFISLVKRNPEWKVNVDRAESFSGKKQKA